VFSGPKPYQFLSIAVLREYLLHEFRALRAVPFGCVAALGAPGSLC
jgi:hypothetical protein